MNDASGWVKFTSEEGLFSVLMPETEDRIFKSRVYMVGRRPYQIVVGSPKGMDDAAIVNRFFNSFKVRAR